MTNTNITSDNNSTADIERVLDSGDPVALRELGGLYWNGTGVEQDRGRAFSLYQQAALAGDVKSHVGLAWSYFTGDGTTQDRTAAEHWIRKAGDLGHEGALAQLGGWLFESAPAHQLDIDIIAEAVDIFYCLQQNSKDPDIKFWALASLGEIYCRVPPERHFNLIEAVQRRRARTANGLN